MAARVWSPCPSRGWWETGSLREENVTSCKVILLDTHENCGCKFPFGVLATLGPRTWRKGSESYNTSSRTGHVPKRITSGGSSERAPGSPSRAWLPAGVGVPGLRKGYWGTGHTIGVAGIGADCVCAA